MDEMIMDRLRMETKTAHQQLERATIPFIKNAVDNASYAFLLRMFYGFFKPVEILIHQILDAGILPDIGERRQSDALVNDLRAIGDVEKNTLIISNELPVIKTIPQALGAMYVLEGSTLGGRYISQMLKKQLNRTSLDDISFFGGYGAKTDEKWKTLTDIINAYAIAHPLNINEIVAAADETFSKFGEWVIFFGEKPEQ